jgi:4-diphosphocytidyl-2C-methyl-D-erythritol kinase
MKSAGVKAYAKVNMILNILGKLPGGYHEIESFMQAIDLADDVSVSWEERPQEEGFTVSLDPGRPDLPADGGHLAYRAAVLMRETFRPALSGHAKIKVEKRIPVAAGLAGGSADGAAVITALARLWGILPEEKEGAESRETAPDCAPHSPLPAALLETAAKLGSDVPFSLMAQNGVFAAVARGTGTELAPAEPVDCALLLLTSPFGVSTKAVYQALRPEDFRPKAKDSRPGAREDRKYGAGELAAPPGGADRAAPRNSADGYFGSIEAFTAAKTLAAKTRHMGNGLTAPALRVCPAIAERLGLLRTAAPRSLAVQLSGSGPTCFAVLPAEDAGEERGGASRPLSGNCPGDRAGLDALLLMDPGFILCRTLTRDPD